MFQSLIGTIKTIIIICVILFLRMFQSLIGTIKTCRKEKENTKIQKFQSLIGTIKTSHNTRTWKPATHVSIPYRDDKNLMKMHKICNIFQVSIPYRDDKNPVRARNIYFLLEFQSLIGTIKTLHVFFHKLFCSSVSIPYRDDKNLVIFWITFNTSLCFNPL